MLFHRSEKNAKMQKNKENGSFAQVGEDVDRKKRPRTAFTAAQIKALEAEFERNK